MPVYTNNPFFESCDEMFQDREGDAYEITGKRDQMRKFMVIVKLKEMGAIGAALAPGIPLPGSFYILPNPNGGIMEYDRLAVLTNISAKQQETNDWKVWVVTCKYSTDIPIANRPGGGYTNSSNDPTEDLATVRWEFMTIQEARQFDLDGQPYVNMAQEAFSPPVMTDLDCPVLKISRNELNFSYLHAARYARCLNNASFLGAPAECVMSMPVTGDQKNRGSFQYWRTNYELRFRPLQQDGTYRLPKINIILPVYDNKGVYIGWEATAEKTNMIDTWQPLLLNQGYHRIRTASERLPNTLAPIYLPGSPHPVTKQQLLTPQGEVAQIEMIAGKATIQAWFIKKRKYRKVDMMNLIVKGVG